jgi:syntaxin 5
MVSEQAEMVERIDANTEDVVDNVAGAQRELLKYWGRVNSNRWLIAKMFGVLVSTRVVSPFPLRSLTRRQMIFFLLWVLIAG